MVYSCGDLEYGSILLSMWHGQPCVMYSFSQSISTSDCLLAMLCKKILAANLFQACSPQVFVADHEAMEVMKRYLRGPCHRP